MTDGSPGWSRRRTLGVLGAGGALAAAGGAGYQWESRRTPAPPRDPYYRGDAGPGVAVAVARWVSGTGTSEVARENARAGTAGFSIDGRRFGDDEHGQIAGYASSTSVEIGGDLDFHVSVAPAQRYRIEVYRVGHYDGAGGRLVAASPWLAGRTQAAPTVDPESRMVRCDWEPGWRLRVDRSWVSGYHLALLTNADGWCRWVPFVVRNPAQSSAGLVVIPTSTYQAYNMWPHDGRTGASLYYGFEASGRKTTGPRSRAVSHDRPYRDSGIPTAAQHDLGFTRWIEGYGDDVTYATNEDLDTGRIDPRRYRAVIFCGHDEYWTIEMRRVVAAARDSGTALVFLGANNCYWRIRYGTSDRRPDDRVVDCAKTRVSRGRPVPLMTQWRSAGSPEQELIGAQYVSMVDGAAPLVIRNSRHWFWAGTGLRDGDGIPRIVAGEADQVMPGVRTPRATERAVLAASPYTRLGEAHTQHSTLYRAPSGAWVFAAGSLGWTAGLYAEGFVDARLQRATRNLLDRVFGVPA
ncbi:N,N-dimethylformamidase beta subunit family domain-containing protein [Plantactinospora sp. CA-290183]|uniref:N,N-dimethylformamidase beta subunit family domain-containing protein n=1 Tax=Plantactinospora sp. CA-290183 TaxID=3240006 RepID=UPI003D8E2F3E